MQVLENKIRSLHLVGKWLHLLNCLTSPPNYAYYIPPPSLQQSLRIYFTQFHLKHWFLGIQIPVPNTINTLLTELPLQLHYLDFWLPQFLWFSFLKKKIFLNIQENVKGYFLSTDKVKHIKILTSEFMIQSQHRRFHWKHSSIISFPLSLIKSDYSVEVGKVSDNFCM